MATSQAVVLDTDVFSALYVNPRATSLKHGHPVGDWEAALEGRRPLITFQTRAESLSGAYLAGWGEKRVDALKARLDATPTLVVDDEVVEGYGRLLAAAQKAGHAFGSSKQHVADKWIAACAIAKELPLLTGNRRHFEGAPGLTLLDLPPA